MAVINAYETWSKRHYGKITNARSATRTWTVLVEPGDGPEVALTAAEIPAMFSQSYTADGGLTVVRVDSKPLSLTLYEVTVEYFIESVDPIFNGGPLDRPAKVRWGAVKYQLPVDVDINGDPYVNTSGEPFDNITRDKTDKLFIVTRNELSYNNNLAMSFEDTINSGTFLNVYPAKSVKCNAITADDFYENGVQYWEVTYEFQIRLPNWTRRMLNAGFKKRPEGPPSGFIKIEDARPILLDQFSYEIVVTPGVTPTVHRIIFEDYEEKVFTPLGFN